MREHTTDLPTDLSVCHQMIQDLLDELQKSRHLNKKLQHQLEQFLRARYGPRADRLDPHQQVLFALEMLAQERADAAEVREEPAPSPSRSMVPQGHGRRPLPDSLPRYRWEHRIADGEQVCPQCGQERVRIGEELSEQLEYIPATLLVIEHVCPKYACQRCGEGVVQALKPMQPIEKGLAGPGLLAHVVTSKFADHLPLYRLEGIFRRHGLAIPRSTTCGWLAATAELLEPLYEEMKAQVLASRVIHTDDTPIGVLEKKRTKTRTGRLWVYVGDRDHPYSVFDYTRSRSRDGPEQFLQGFRGYLQADAYAGYDGIYARGEVIEVACWAHTRRKYIEAQTTDPRRAATAVASIKRLYEIEEQAKGLTAGERCALRQQWARPLLDTFGQWLRQQRAQVLPKSPIGEAIGYTLSNWEALGCYCTDGDLAIDNNAAERALRNVAVGRKNYLFAGSDGGGRTAAVLYSFTVTCKSLGIDPFAYLRDVIQRISSHPMKRLSELLPDRWAADPQRAALAEFLRQRASSSQ